MCGLEAKFFAIERFTEGHNRKPFLQLYGRIGNDDVLFNIDHVVPRCRGGKNTMSNLVTTCEPCNQKKADSKYIHVIRKRTAMRSLDSGGEL
jgi:hypothetical protein